MKNINTTFTESDAYEGQAVAPFVSRRLVSRRGFIAGGSILCLTAFAGSGATALINPAFAADDLIAHVMSPRFIGQNDAPIQVAEYYSMTCGHCANFHNKTFPKIKTRLIDEGIVRFEMRAFPLDGLALRAHALARALPEAKFFPMVKLLLAKQSTWTRAPDPIAALQKMARIAGIDEDAFNMIMRNRALLTAIVEEKQKGSDTWKIDSTPSFVINDDKLISGGRTYDAFAEEISAYEA